MSNISKIFLAITIIVLLFATIWSRNKDSTLEIINESKESIEVGNNRDSETIRLADYYNLLLKNDSITYEDFLSFPPEIITSKLSPDDLEAYLFVEIPMLSGTGGAAGRIIAINLGSKNGHTIGSFFGVRKVISDSARIDNNFLIFVEIDSSGSGRERAINLVDNKKSIEINLPDTLEDYAKRHNLNADLINPNFYEGDIEWVDESNIRFKRRVTTFIGDTYPTETWQYNVDTREYTLISSDEN